MPDDRDRKSPAGAGPADLSSRAHRQLIGYLGLLMPFILVALAATRPTPEIRHRVVLDSLSAYYYTGAVAAFTGILFSLALFLFTYRGYKDSGADRIVGAIGGASALGVALFPTGAPADLVEPSWWLPLFRVLHYVSAAVLFVSFIVFALWLFRKTDVPKGQPLPPGKIRRNRIFLVCGITMAACVVWAAWSGRNKEAIFWPESIAVWAFAVSWLVKGRAHQSIAEAARRAVGR